MRREVYVCKGCNVATTYHKPGYPCAYCGGEMVAQSLFPVSTQNYTPVKEKETPCK